MAPASGATALEIFLVSALAKLGATIVTYPLLLIKQRLQSAGKHTHADRKYTSTADAVRRIWQNEGECIRQREATCPLGVCGEMDVTRSAIQCLVKCSDSLQSWHSWLHVLRRGGTLCWVLKVAIEGSASLFVMHAGLLGFYAGMNTKIVQSILAAALMMAIKEKITAGTRAVLETPNASPSVLQEQAKTLVTGVK